MHFPLFQSHLDVAHSYWKSLVASGDLVIDATCGNGHDTLLLAQLALSENEGSLYAVDVQPSAIENTRKRLEAALAPGELSRIHLVEQSHENFPVAIAKESVKLIVYNLGYLPGGDKGVTTCVTTTLESLQNALVLVQPGGCISVTAYPGHDEGMQEFEQLIPFFQSLDKKLWSCCQHSWLNRRRAPSLFIVQKAL